MSMHLMGPAFSTTSTKKRKKKTLAITEKLMSELKTYNKQMKRMGLKTKTIEEYIDYRQGNSKYVPKKIIKDPMKAEPLVRQSPRVPSASDGVGNGFSKPVNTYTGSKLLGIATMHKSNMVPVFSASDAEEISKMRRG